MTIRWMCQALALCLVLSLATGCSKNNGGNGNSGPTGKKVFLSMGTSPTGGAFGPVGSALADTMNANKIDVNWSVLAKGTLGSQQNIRQLDDGELDLALANAAITYRAVRGEGAFTKKKYDLRVIMTLPPNVAMFLTKKSSGIKTLADLKGKRVVIGPPGAGFEMFVEPILKAHGISYDDLDVVNAGQSQSVDMLGDGIVDAAFLGGAPPTGGIIQACSSPGYEVFFIPFDEKARTQLVADNQFFKKYTLSQDVYTDLEADFEGLNVGSMHLITTASKDADLVYQITKSIYQNREYMITQHKTAGTAIEKNATLDTGVEFHPGAIRFYEEIGIWKKEGSDSLTDDTDPSNDKGAAKDNN